MSQLTARRLILPVSLLQIAIIVLTVITALIHLQRGISMMGFAHAGAGAHAGPGGPGGLPAGGRRPGGGGAGGPGLLAMIPVPLPTLFLLNCVAYLILGGLLYLPALKTYRRIIRWLLIVLAAVTIVAYFLIAGTHYNLLGYIDKPIEVLLIILLFVDDWQETHQRLA